MMLNTPPPPPPPKEEIIELILVTVYKIKYVEYPVVYCGL